MVRVLHLTDTHLYATPERLLYQVNTRDSLRAVIQHARQTLPEIDVVMVTGDLVHDESTAGYQALHQLVQVLDRPVFYLPGNHDDVSVMQQILPNCPQAGILAVKRNAWSILLLDTSMPDRVEGELSAESLMRLEDYLGSHPDNPVLIALHHHVRDIQSPWLDALNLRNQHELINMIERYPQVKLVINGHIHQENDVTHNAIRYLGTPSTCFQFMPQQAQAAIDTKPPGYRYLELADDGSVSTQVWYVEGYSS